VSGASLPTLLGYARNTVWDPEPDGYPWPVPQASFVVFGCSAGHRARLADDLTWGDPHVVERECRTRHWWPIYAAQR
jgi:hypothetical protein